MYNSQPWSQELQLNLAGIGIQQQLLFMKVMWSLLWKGKQPASSLPPDAWHSRTKEVPACRERKPCILNGQVSALLLRSELTGRWDTGPTAHRSRQHSSHAWRNYEGGADSSAENDLAEQVYPTDFPGERADCHPWNRSVHPTGALQTSLKYFCIALS